MAEDREYWLVQRWLYWAVLCDITDWGAEDKRFVKEHHGKVLGPKELEGTWGSRTVDSIIEDLVEDKALTYRDEEPLKVRGTLYWVAIDDGE